MAPLCTKERELSHEICNPPIFFLAKLKSGGKEGIINREPLYLSLELLFYHLANYYVYKPGKDKFLWDLVFEQWWKNPGIIRKFSKYR